MSNKIFPPQLTHPGWQPVLPVPLKGTSAPQLSVHQSFLSGKSGNWTTSLPVIGWPTLTTEPRPPQIKEHDPNSAACFAQKHADDGIFNTNP